MKTQGYIFSQAQSEKHEKSLGFREIVFWYLNRNKSILLRWLVISTSLQRPEWTKQHHFQTFQLSPAKYHCTITPHLPIINHWYNRFF